MKNWGTERLRIFSKATKLLSGRPGIRALALQHIWFCPEQLLETCGQHEKVLFKTSLETSDPHLKVCDIWSCPKMSQTSHIVQWDIWSMPKGPWYLVLFHMSTETFGPCPKFLEVWDNWRVEAWTSYHPGSWRSLSNMATNVMIKMTESNPYYWLCS